MNARSIVTPAGERLVLLSDADFNALVQAAEDNADSVAVEEFRRKLAAGEEEAHPERRRRPLPERGKPREHRRMTSKALAGRAGLAQAFASQIETGKRAGTVDTMRTIAGALSVTLDDLPG